MKKLLLFGTLLIAFNVNSQNSFLVFPQGGSATNSISPNEVIEMASMDYDITKKTFDIQNTGTVTAQYIVKRYDVVLNDSAKANFCFAGTCYGPPTMVSPNALTLTAGEKASDVTGTFQMLDADLDEQGNAGYSWVKYTVANAANSSDSLQFSIKYNILMGVNELKNSISSVNIYPNPVQDNATLNITTASPREAKISIYNALGSVVSEKQVLLNEGNNKIELNTSSLQTGIYFASVKTGKNIITRRFIVK